MLQRKYAAFEGALGAGNEALHIHCDLTYRCSARCLHCYCAGSRGRPELSAAGWERIIGEAADVGCLWLTFTGGEPLIRPDFLRVYRYARQRGMLVRVFTSGTVLPAAVLACWRRLPPLSVECSIYGSTAATHDALTRLPGSFAALLRTVRTLRRAGIAVALKTVGLAQNRREIADIRALAVRLLGRGKYSFDSYVTPRLDGSLAPCRHRLSPAEAFAAERADPVLCAGQDRCLSDPHRLRRPRRFRFQCDSWKTNFFVTPEGQLRFCRLSPEYSTDLRRTSLAEGLRRFRRILEDTFTRDSVCRDCRLRRFCLWCPPRAFLETGDAFGKVDYFCARARLRRNAFFALRRGGRALR